MARVARGISEPRIPTLFLLLCADINQKGTEYEGYVLHHWPWRPVVLISGTNHEYVMQLWQQAGHTTFINESAAYLIA